MNQNNIHTFIGTFFLEGGDGIHVNFIGVNFARVVFLVRGLWEVRKNYAKVLYAG